MKWNFSPLFYSRKLRSMLYWFIIFEFKLWSGMQNNFSIPPKLANSSQKVRHSARGQNMQISMVDVIRCVKPSSHYSIWVKEWRGGKFFVTGGPVLASCKTPLTRKALSCLYFRKTKSEQHIVSDLLGNTGPTAKRRMRPCCPSIRTKLLSTVFKQWRSSAMEMS